jgi:hypothetical protein
MEHRTPMTKHLTADRANRRHLGTLAAATAAVAAGAVAIGVLVIRKLWIRHLVVDRADLRSLQIEELHVVRLRAEDVTVTTSMRMPVSDQSRRDG